jgi:hypothetical protein
VKVIKRLFPLSGRSDEFRLHLFGDTHLGSKSVAEHLLKKHIKEVEESGDYWCHLGDVIDGILPGDRRFKSDNVADWAWDALKSEKLIEAEWNEFERLFDPIKDKCLFVLDGDGKHNSCANVANCMVSTLKRMNAPGGSPLVYYAFTFTRNDTTSFRMDVVFHHGWFSGRKHGGKANNLVDALAIYPKAHGFFCGHGHTKHQERIDSLRLEGNHIKQWVRRAGMTGSYLKTYDEDTTGYGEIKGYSPAGLGRITVVFRPFAIEDEKIIEVENA